MVHKSIAQYSGEAAANLNLGQPGFLLINSSTNTHSPGEGSASNTKYYSELNQWVAIKNVTDPNSGLDTNGAIKVDLRCFVGLSGTGNSAITIHLASGDIVFGPFSGVKINSGTDATILAYIG